jgi:putative superfamily III holin-X
MVDQAQITPTNGRTELPPRAVARNTAEFLHDVATLAELQGNLVLLDVREGLAKLVMPVIAIGAGIAVGLGCVPIALAALALTLKATTTLNYASCFGIALAVGLVLSALLAIPAFFALKRGVRMFDRSLYELGRNTKWVKDTLKRLQSGPHHFSSRSSHW